MVPGGTAARAGTGQPLESTRRHGTWQRPFMPASRSNPPRGQPMPTNWASGCDAASRAPNGCGAGRSAIAGRWVRVSPGRLWRPGLSIYHVANLPPYPVRQLHAGVTLLADGRLRRSPALPGTGRRSRSGQIAARFARGVALHRAGDHLRALPDLQFAAENAARDPLMYEVLGDSLLEQQEVSRGLRRLRVGRTNRSSAWLAGQASVCHGIGPD